MSEQRPLVIKLSEDLRYFNLSYKDSNSTNTTIINAGRHFYYRNILIFINCIKDLVKELNDNRVKDYILGYLYSEALI